MAWNGFWHFLFAIFDHFGLGINACNTITRCLSLRKKKWEIVPEKGIFHPLHNDTKSVFTGPVLLWFSKKNNHLHSYMYFCYFLEIINHPLYKLITKTILLYVCYNFLHSFHYSFSAISGKIYCPFWQMQCWFLPRSSFKCYTVSSPSFLHIFLLIDGQILCTSPGKELSFFGFN